MLQESDGKLPEGCMQNCMLSRGVVRWERVGTAFPHLFAPVTLLENVGSKRLDQNMAAISEMC